MRTKHNATDSVTKDEYYTLRETADEVAAYAARYLSLDTPIDCPADTDDSEIPKALRAAGFECVRNYCDLPTLEHCEHVTDGAAIVTNPPFSMKTAFSSWLRSDTSRKFIVCCTLVDLPYFFGGSITELLTHNKYKRPDGKLAGVATCWVTNFGSALRPLLSAIAGRRKGNCRFCLKDTCVMQKTDTPLYSVHTAAKAGGVYSFCNRYQTLRDKCSFGRVFLAGEFEPTLREIDRRK